MIDRSAWREELDARRAAARAVFERHGCDTGLVYGSQGHAEHFRYLTNFAPVIGDMWAILPEDAPMECVLNFTWQLDEARRDSGIDQWTGAFSAAPLVAERLAPHAPVRIGIASRSRIPVADYEALRARLPEAELVEVGDELAALRRRKSGLELRLLREAARVTDLALEEIRGELLPGRTEKEIAARLEHILGQNGARPAFFTCVISGITDPIPIRLPTDRPLEPGDTVMIDMGAEIGGYQADASRTFVLGRPSPEQERAWNVVEHAYQAALELARPGTPCLDLDQAAAAIIEEAGYEVAHRVGHGIGLATSFEWPSLDSEEAPLMPGMTICIEPGIYARGAGNVKLEDDVLITDHGHELITTSSRNLEVSLP